jgi:triosephosphate isomerase (TIM)
MPRRPFIAGNWKMHKGPAEAEAFARVLKSTLVVDDTDVALAPPFPSIPAVATQLKDTGIEVAAQNLHADASGPFTGEVAGEMLRELGCAYVIVGHSERRAIFGETDEIVARKIAAAFRAGLLPIVCVGESLAERDRGEEKAVVERQLSVGLRGLRDDQMAAVTLAYEPVWAIGTGRTATPEQAQEMHAFVRGWLGGAFPAYVAQDTRIQYGGSVKPDNAAKLLGQPDIDGALVGGASLDADAFVTIVRAAQQR